MKQASRLSTLRMIVIILSVIMMLGSGYLFIQNPDTAVNNPLFKVLIGLLVVDLALFIWFKIASSKFTAKNKATKTPVELSQDSIHTKDPKPHSEK